MRHKNVRLRAVLFCAALALCEATLVQGQPGAQPLVLTETHYRLRAGESVPISAASDTLEFMRTATRQTASISGGEPSGFVVGPSVKGDQLLLAASLRVKPGEYSVNLSVTGSDGEARAATIDVVLDPMQTVPNGTTRPPVVLLNGFQLGFATPITTCSVSASSADTFGSLENDLLADGAPVVYFFDNCREDPAAQIEQLGNDLATFLGLIKYANGQAVPQVDLVGHSMGGLIVRSYLAGLQPGGSVSPPANPGVRKFIEIATPNFGSFIAENFSVLSYLVPQAAEMVPGSAFLWNLATWNQRGDDLRGVDALAIAGNAGRWTSSSSSLSNASDGVVSLTSASLGFARDPSRTRILPYCHTDVSALLNPTLETMDCSGGSIANVDEAPDTGDIVRSFLANTQAWSSIGTPASDDYYLSQFGGFYFAVKNAAAEYVSGLTSVSWGPLALTDGGAANTIFFIEFAQGTGTFPFTTSLGSAGCSVPVQVGTYSAFRCKEGADIVSVTPMVPNITGKVVQSGTQVTIAGSSFGSQCAGCQVLAYPGKIPLSVSSWTASAITASLPASFNGYVQLVVITSNSGSDSINTIASSVFVNLTASSASGVAVTPTSGAISPGEIIMLKGSGLGPATGVSFSVDPSTGMVDTTLSGTQVFVNGLPAPILYTSAGQINAIVPYEVAGQSQVMVQASYQGVMPPGPTLQIASAAPAAFTFNATGAGQTAAANDQDGSLNGPSHPASAGSYVTIYFTGGGETNPAGVTGSVTGSGLKLFTQKVSVTVGGQPAAVSFAGAAPDLVDGVGQLNIQLAGNTPSGSAEPLVITVGGISSPATATLAVTGAAGASRTR